MIDEPNAPHPEPPVPPRRSRHEIISRLIIGATIGAFTAWLFSELAFADRAARYVVLISAVLGASLNLTRVTKLVSAIGAISVLTILVIAFTPLVPWLLKGPAQSDPLEPCDAIVSLGAGMNDDGTLGSGTQDRAIYSLTLLHARYAPVLVLTGNEAQGESIIRRQMRALGLSFPIENCGPVHDTHDESVAVARLFKAHGWRRVILVTHDWHMRRAAAAFEKAGVHALRSPCPDTHCDMHNPSRLPDRLRALACVIHETLGYRVYHLHGWL